MVNDSQNPSRTSFKDPRPNVERISQLAQRVLSGDILLPKFQRDFVWSREKVLGLWDSIARNYPIGSILLWQSRNKLASERSIAGLDIADRRPDYPVNYLLDGQQRLSTICGALYWKPGEGKDDQDSIWNIAYDLRSQDFVHLHKVESQSLTQIPLRNLSDPSSYFRRISAIEDEEHRERADLLFNRVHDYMIAAVTLADMPMEDIAPIFERINSTATPLTIVDLMRAATWSPDFDLRESIDSILDGISERDFGYIDRKTVLRAISAASGFGFAVDDIDRLRHKGTDELRDIVDDVEKSAKRAVDFLTTHVKAPRPQALPYANQFAVLTELFRKVPRPTSSQFSEIEKWFWRTTLSSYFGGWNTGQMTQDWRMIDSFSQVQDGQLEVAASLPRHDIWKVSQFRSNSAVSKMLALILSFQDPLDLLTGQRIDARKSLDWGNDKEFHHFFPKAFLRSKNFPIGKANAAANIVLLSSHSNIKIRDAAPSKYLTEIANSVGWETLRERASALLISEPALQAALEDDYSSFLEQRSKTLHDYALFLAGENSGATQETKMENLHEALVSDPGVDELAPQQETL